MACVWRTRESVRCNTGMPKAAVLPDTLVGGEVILTFRVNRFGRPSEIRTEQGPTRELNREAVRLIESGNLSAGCIQAANEALSGVTNVGSATHFRRAGGRDGIVIGNHVFW